MNSLIAAAKALPEFNQLTAAIELGKTPAAVNGLSAIHKAHFAAALRRLTGRQVVLVLSDDLAVQRITNDLAAFSGETPTLLPSRELTLYSAAGVSRDWERRRLKALYSAATGEAGLFAVSLDALSSRTIPKNKLAEAVLTLRVGGEYSLDELTMKLSRAGYKRCRQVEGEGQFALRGGILDFFSPAQESPVRAEFFGDELDSMGFFSTETQRRTENISSALILPAAETLPQLHDGGMEGLLDDIRALIARQKRRKNPNQALIETLQKDAELLSETPDFAAVDRYMALIYPEPVCAADYFTKETLFVLCDHGQLAARSKNRTEELGQELDSLLQSGALAGELCDFSATWEELCHVLSSKTVVYLDNFLGAAYPDELSPKTLLSLMSKQLPSYGGSLDTAISDLKHYQSSGFSTLVLCGSQRRADNLRLMLEERFISVSTDVGLSRLPGEGEVTLSVCSLSSGIEYTSIKLVILTEGQLLPATKKTAAKRKKKLPTNRQKLASFADLSPGDLVVHEQYGIGRFVGIETLTVDGAERDYIQIAYQGTDKLLLPATRLDLVTKYIGGGEDSPVKLNRLGGDTWTKTKARAKAAAKDLAKDLIELYAERKRRSGHAFAPDDSLQREFEEAFEYVETDDQLRCIKEIKEDMESTIPMDRLLCGDVGFGKTEVALRAVMKCILDGKQAAILAPTTVLVQQHYITAMKRFAGFGANIDVLSRFRSPQQLRKALHGAEAGTIDLIIGTHKLLQKDMKFKDLGLLVVDEEQRFGVSHKERLKEMSRQVDVLTLSATPIPRTLNMALSGIRDMSTLEEPPQDRHPVQTYVIEHDEGVIKDAICREIARGGQVYYLHNRVDNIERTAAKIAAMAEGASIAVAHGKMHEDELSGIMQQMADGEIQILVCTTIIETGIDIPNVNTLIIEDADKMGLSQLHQLRGRVGRSSRHAFAYLTYRRGKELSEIAEKRLGAIREFAEFGSGFKIAMRDLELRGAGNVLGSEQSGHMISVGYDMYLKLLEEAVLEERGEKPEQAQECSADLIISANIPDRYVAAGEDRMDLYRRIAAIRSEEDADDLTDELIDRFGDPPRSVNALVGIALLRAEAAEAGISDVSQKAGRLLFSIAVMDFLAVSTICGKQEYKGRVMFSAGEKPCLTFKLVSGEDVLKTARAFVAAYSACREARA